jgi:RNA polymerase sigma-70 factor (ECF subfamily)
VSPADFQRLVEQHEQAIFRFIRRMVGPAWVEDLTQEVFMKAWAAERTPGPGAEKGWLFTIANNLCVDHLRSRHYDRRRKERWAVGLEPPAHGVEQSLVDAEDRERLARAVDELPEKQKQVLLLKVEGGFTFAEVAAMLKEPPDTVASRMYAAVESLRQTLKREHAK